MFKLKRSGSFLLAQLFALLIIGAVSFQTTRVALASSTTGTLGVASPHSHTDGNATNLTPVLTLDVGSYRLFNVLSDHITWNNNDAAYVNGNQDSYSLGFHIFNYNSLNCWRSGVTEAHDAWGNQIPGSVWGNNLPNSNGNGDLKKNAKCQGQADGSENNELRFNVRNGGPTIVANSGYYVYASFVDYNYPSAKAWVEVTYNFIHDYFLNHNDIYYNSNKGDKICANGYDNITFPPGAAGNCP